MTLKDSLKTLAAGIATMAFAASGFAATPEVIHVRTDWTPWGVDAALYLAKQKGWYKQAGLDVQVEDGVGSTNTVQLIGAGKFDVGLANLGPMIIARDRGIPVVAIASFVRQNDTGLLVPASEHWTRPKDLVGKRVAITPGASGAPFFDQFFANDGVSPSQITRVNVDSAAQTATYIAGRVDATVSSIPFFLPIVAQQRPSTAIRFGDYGLPLPSFGLLTNASTLAARGPALTKFASVTAGAWEYIEHGHADEAVDAIAAQRPDIKIDKNIVRKQIDVLLTFFQTPATKGMPAGFMAEADWAGALKTLSQAKLLKHEEAPGKYFTNTMLDRALIERIANSK